MVRQEYSNILRIADVYMSVWKLILSPPYPHLSKMVFFRYAVFSCNHIFPLFFCTFCTVFYFTVHCQFSLIILGYWYSMCIYILEMPPLFFVFLSLWLIPCQIPIGGNPPPPSDISASLLDCLECERRSSHLHLPVNHLRWEACRQTFRTLSERSPGNITLPYLVQFLVTIYMYRLLFLNSNQPC
jgi:hypothetical protein